MKWITPEMFEQIRNTEDESILIIDDDRIERSRFFNLLFNENKIKVIGHYYDGSYSNHKIILKFDDVIDKLQCIVYL